MNKYPLIKQKLHPYRAIIKKIRKAINHYDRIVVFRHLLPDFDALGSQMGLVTWLKNNYPHKDIRYVGDNHGTFSPRIYPLMEVIDQDYFLQPFLAIVLDTANRERIADDRWKKGELIIKIDHHPIVDQFAHLNLEITSMAAASEIISALLALWSKKTYLSKEAATFLYIALVGDSGRFMYSSTSSHTFEVANYLLTGGFDLSKDVYQKMYLKSLDDLKITAFVLGNFKVSPHGIAYYVIDKETQKQLNITPERGKENINIFANIEGVNAWCSISEDSKDNVWRISIRSKEKPINQVAQLYGGGGHAQASGAKIDRLDQLDEFINALDILFIK